MTKEDTEAAATDEGHEEEQVHTHTPECEHEESSGTETHHDESDVVRPKRRRFWTLKRVALLISSGLLLGFLLQAVATYGG